MWHSLSHTNWLSSPEAGEHRQGPRHLLCLRTAMWPTSALGIKHSAVPRPYSNPDSPCCSLWTDLHVEAHFVCTCTKTSLLYSGIDLTLRQTWAFYYVLQAKVLFYWKGNNSSKLKHLTLDSLCAWCLDLGMTPISQKKALFRQKIREQTLI